MEKSVNIKPFLDETGKITKLPRKQGHRIAVLEYLAGKFEPDVMYTERQVNEICNCWHTFDDHFLLRRELVDYKLLDRERDGSRYWLVKKSKEQQATPEKDENADKAPEN